MTSFTLLWRSIRNSEGRITRIDDLENDQFYTKSAHDKHIRHKTQKGKGIYSIV